MPNIFVYDTGRPKTTKFTLAFARGVIRNTHSSIDKWVVKHAPIQQYLDHGAMQPMRFPRPRMLFPSLGHIRP